MIEKLTAIENPLIATGASSGGMASIEHVVDAVDQAMKKAGLSQAGGVLLFLSNGYALDPKPAIRAAAKRASTMQVFGCSANGLISNAGIILDTEGAVAMVFPDSFSPMPASVLADRNQLNAAQSLVCISSPQASKIAINHLPYKMIGAISSNEYGQGDFPVWHSSRIAKSGFFHLGFSQNIKQFITVSQGIRRLSKNLKITQAKANRIDSINNKAALTMVKKSLPENLHDMFIEQPYHTLAAVSEADDPKGLNKNFLKISNVVAVDESKGAIHLSDKVKTNQHLFWALRDRALAEQEIQHNVSAVKAITKKPKFALLFSSISRGPYFFSKENDADFTHFKKQFPDLPMIGIYGTGEISPGQHYDALSRRYSSVLTVFE